MASEAPGDAARCVLPALRRDADAHRADDVAAAADGAPRLLPAGPPFFTLAAPPSADERGGDDAGAARAEYDAGAFREIRLSRRMFADHMPDVYTAAIECAAAVAADPIRRSI